MKLYLRISPNIMSATIITRILPEIQDAIIIFLNNSTATNFDTFSGYRSILVAVPETERGCIFSQSLQWNIAVNSNTRAVMLKYPFAGAMGSSSLYTSL